MLPPPTALEVVAERHQQRDDGHEVGGEDPLGLREVTLALELIAEQPVRDHGDVELPAQRVHRGSDRGVAGAGRGEIHLARASDHAGTHIAKRRDQCAQLLWIAPGHEDTRPTARIHVRNLGGDRRRRAEDRDALPARARRHGATTRSNMPPATSR